ncbi:18762_t:CDS:2 [Gigaspora margarita]|uniref:18762_t:CDS:1 n=1 Tax=Gigaspora margarita TaxID=4874 RepID=A0ABM8W125_GIGMA|nr:18762_t:CDS:2 [Gigaspora margarita]
MLTDYVIQHYPPDSESESICKSQCSIRCEYRILFSQIVDEDELLPSKLQNNHVCRIALSRIGFNRSIDRSTYIKCALKIQKKINEASSNCTDERIRSKTTKSKLKNLYFLNGDNPFGPNCWVLGNKLAFGIQDDEDTAGARSVKDIPFVEPKTKSSRREDELIKYIIKYLQGQKPNSQYNDELSCKYEADRLKDYYSEYFERNKDIVNAANTIQNIPQNCTEDIQNIPQNCTEDITQYILQNFTDSRAFI